MKTLVIIPITLLWLVWIALLLNIEGGMEQQDIAGYHRAASCFIAQEPVYSTDGFPRHYCAYIYPPFTAQMMMPLARYYDVERMKQFWYRANIIILVITIALLIFHLRDTYYVRLIWLFPLFFTPIIQNLRFGQIVIILLFLLSGAWIARKRHLPDLSGGLLAVATWIKIFPIFLLIYAIWRRDWGVVRGGLVVGFAILFIQIIISPPHYLWDYFTMQLPALMAEGQTFSPQNNSSLMGQSLRLFVNSKHNVALINAPQYVDAGRYIMLIILFGVSGFALHRSYEQAEDYLHAVYDTEFALVLLVATWFSPTLWIAGLTLLLLVYILFFVNESNRFMIISGAISFGLLVVYLPILFGRPPDTAWSWWINSLGFLGVAILWLLLVFQIIFYQRRELELQVP